MDFLAGGFLLEKFVTATPATSATPPPSSKNTVATVVSSIIGVLIGMYAAYLSWSCNSAIGLDTPIKVFYAFWAFFFGLLYLIFYVLFRAGTCYPRVIQVTSATAPAPAAVTAAPAVTGGRRMRSHRLRRVRR